MVEYRNRRIKAVILDWNRTLVKGDDSPAAFFSEVPLVLQELNDRRLKMGIVSAGGEDPSQRWRDFEKLDLKSLGVSEFAVIGANEPKELMPVVEKLGVTPTECIVVGDRITKEIAEGRKIGATTFRVQRPGDKFAGDVPQTKEQEPDYTRDSLEDLPSIIDELNSKVG